MRRHAPAALAASVVLAAGCGDDLSGTPGEIADSLERGCPPSEVKHEAWVPEGEEAGIGSHAEETVSVFCDQHTGDYVYYAKFESSLDAQKATAALKSAIPRGALRIWCIAPREMFSARFKGAKELCEEHGGEVHRFWGPPKLTRRLG